MTTQELQIAKLRYLLYEAIVELEYVQVSEDHSLCASAKGREIVERGMKLLEVKDLSQEHLVGAAGGEHAVMTAEQVILEAFKAGLEEAAKKLDFEGHTCNTPNYTDGPCYACAKEKLMEWVFERYENCVKISDEKTGKDRAGWLEDADHFMLILQLFKAAAIREKIAGEG